MPATRIIGIDFGLKRIGIAISDESKMLASPYKTIGTGKKMEETVRLLLKELEADCAERGYSIQEFVVGMPLMMSGSSGFMADEVRHFIDLLQKSGGHHVETWDERLTSVQAERSLMEGSMSRKKRSKVVDTVAAVIILQNYLDRKGLQQNTENN